MKISPRFYLAVPLFCTTVARAADGSIPSPENRPTSLQAPKTVRTARAPEAAAARPQVFQSDRNLIQGSGSGSGWGMKVSGEVGIRVSTIRR